MAAILEIENTINDISKTDLVGIWYAIVGLCRKNKSKKLNPRISQRGHVRQAGNGNWPKRSWSLKYDVMIVNSLTS